VGYGGRYCYLQIGIMCGWGRLDGITDGHILGGTAGAGNGMSGGWRHPAVTTISDSGAAVGRRGRVHVRCGRVGERGRRCGWRYNVWWRSR
jgi:hypothetical protein